MEPLRELIDAHHAELTGRLERIERKLDKGHGHSNLVPWSAFVTVLVAATGVLVSILS